MDLGQMSQIIRSLPQYNELLSKYTLHMKLIEKCWNVIMQFNNKKPINYIIKNI
jgi:hypothetical protein